MEVVAGSLRADTQRFPTDAPVVLVGFGRRGFIFFAVLFLWVKFISPVLFLPTSYWRATIIFK